MLLLGQQSSGSATRWYFLGLFSRWQPPPQKITSAASSSTSLIRLPGRAVVRCWLTSTVLWAHGIIRLVYWYARYGCCVCLVRRKFQFWLILWWSWLVYVTLFRLFLVIVIGLRPDFPRPPQCEIVSTGSGNSSIRGRGAILGAILGVGGAELGRGVNERIRNQGWTDE